MGKRVFLMVIDSMGCGELPDAYKWGDEGSNTLRTIRQSKDFNCPNMVKMGLLSIDGVTDSVPKMSASENLSGIKHVTGEFGSMAPSGVESDNAVISELYNVESDAARDSAVRLCNIPTAAFGRLAEVSMGKDTTTGHWEIAGLVSEKPMPTFPDGFPEEFLDEYSKRTGHKWLCNKVYSGTEVIKDYGRQQIEENALIIYTSADSVFQIAAHEESVPVPELYRCCEIAREMLTGDLAVGRVIARPYTGDWPYTRTSNRHDYSVVPPQDTMLDVLKNAGFETISVGKIYDIFAGKGLSESNRTVSNADGLEKTKAMIGRDFEGLCFINLVETDSTYGHRNDIDGYAKAVSEIDACLGEIVPRLREDDILIVTADHGCDPGTPSTDHSREYIPMLVTGPKIKAGTNLGTRTSFGDIAASILEYFALPQGKIIGTSFLKQIIL